MPTYRKETRVSRCLIGLVQVDIGLIVASLAAMAIGFAFTSAGPHAIGSDSTEPQADLAGPGAIASAVGQTERASELFVASAPSATFDERFHLDEPAASFDERFASAFGSSGNAAGRKLAKAGEQTDDILPQQPDLGEQSTGKPAAAQPVITPAPASRHASLREGRINTAGASLRLPLDSESHTAIYDIAARTVYLPNGQRLEAHSGLGSRLDDPRYINAKGQGPTPPNVYNLTLRERLFHGVRAIRLVPVDDRKMFGRDGILAHTYMLGPNGQSNGCVSFRNYPAFLTAFLKGEVDRLVVVEHLATTTGTKVSAASGG